MKFIITYIFAFIALGCNDTKSNNKPKKELLKAQTETLIESKKDRIDLENGFLYVSIKKIYYNKESLVILNKEKDTLAFFKETNISLDKKTFDIINDEHLYKDELKINTYNPEYGLFIIECKGIENEYYKVVVNNTDCFIKVKENTNLLKFKTPKQHVMESYPYLIGKNKTPLRKEPNDKSEIIEGYKNYSYISVEVKGDWLKVKDDKDCYIGEEPSKEDIIGWVRWKKDGKIIIDIRHSC